MNLVQEGKDKQAKAVLDKAEKALPSYNIPHDYQSGSLDLAKAYALTGQTKKAQEIIENLWKKSTEYMLWYCSLSADRFAMSQQECLVHMYILNQILNLESAVDAKKAKEKEAQFKAIGNLYETKGGTYGE
jgi:predicted Zn-dependent protease